MSFTDKELYTLSNGILALIRDAGEAKKLVNSKGAQNAIECEINSLVSLNSKICGMMSTKSAVLRT